MTLLVGDHVRQKLLHGAPMADQVDVEKFPQRFNWNVKDGVSIADARVVD